MTFNMKKINTEINFVTTTDITIRNILQNAGATGLALYISYLEITQWQGNNRVKATTKFMAKRLSLGESTIIKYKKKLIELDFVEDYKDIDNETKKVKGWYVKIKHRVSKNHPVDFQGVDFPGGGNVMTSTSIQEESTSIQKKVEEKVIKTFKTEEIPKDFIKAFNFYTSLLKYVDYDIEERKEVELRQSGKIGLLETEWKRVGVFFKQITSNEEKKKQFGEALKKYGQETKKKKQEWVDNNWVGETPTTYIFKFSNFIYRRSEKSGVWENYI